MGTKQTIIFEAPVQSASGYGEHAREVANFLIPMFDSNFHIVETHWGHTQSTCNSKTDYIKYISKKIEGDSPIDIYIQMALPSEFKAIGNINVGITALIECSVCSEDFVRGCNKMNIVVFPSNFAKKVLEDSAKKYGINLSCDIRVIPQTTNITTDKSELDLNYITEDFCFLFNGKWNIDSNVSAERKNIETLIRCFVSAFQSHSTKPALILKTHNKNYSKLDYTRTETKIKSIINEVHTELSVPSVYLLHVELSDSEMKSLYTDDKVKCYVSCSRGEGFGRPVLEASMYGLPVIASKWSGHCDIVLDELNYIIGDLVETPHINNGMGEGAMWYKCTNTSIQNKLLDVYENYDQYKVCAKNTQSKNKKEFCSDLILNKYKDIFNSYIQSNI